ELRAKQAVVSVKQHLENKSLTSTIKEKPTADSMQIKAVNYEELIPIMIKAMQEQSATIQAQNDKIEQLSQLVNKLSSNAGSGSVKISDVSLGQSTPNPNRITTRIDYNIS